MKKLFTAMAALALCASAAFAQDEEVNIMDFNPETNLNDPAIINPTEVITAVLNENAPSGAIGAMVMPVSGYGFSQNPQEPFPAALNGDTITFTLEKEMWGEPFNGTYYLQLMVVLLDEENEPMIDPITEEYVMGMAAYQCQDLNPATWVRNFPSERNFTEEGLTFAEFYNMGVCTFYFTKDVTLPSGSIGTIVYTTDSTTTRSRITDYTAEWDEDLGLYAVSVDVRNEDYTAADLDGIKVTLSGVKDGNDQVITVPALEVDNNDVVPQRAPKKRGIETGLISDVETLNIYNVQGMLVKENVSASAVNELPAGLYIVNGKKVVVR